jgi:hypothetical protein
MADEQSEIRRVKWDEVFSFVHLFKSGWAALQPAKLILALAAILLLYVTGQVMGWLWGVCGQTARHNEICLFATENPVKFKADQARWKDSERQGSALALARDARDERKNLTSVKTAMNALGVDKVFDKRFADIYKDDPDKDLKAPKDEEDQDWPELLYQGRNSFRRAFDKAEKVLNKGDFVADVVKVAGEDFADANRNLKGEKANRQRADVESRAKTSAGQAFAKLSELKRGVHDKARVIEGWNVFESFTDYQGWCLQGMLRSAWRGNLCGGWDRYMNEQRDRGIPPIAYAAPSNLLPKDQAPAQPAEGGVIYWILMACHGVTWLFCRHWVFAAIYTLIALAVWALLGGAVYRVAALNITRGEKISIRQALRFSLGKFLSFFSAPLILLVVIFGLGAVLIVGAAAFGNFGGGIVMALFFPIALVIGLLIAFLTIGLVTGGGLMYPTIAVEGSDSFDGISRSFSYVFNRPSRSILYGAVAVVYGALCYLILRLFVFVGLAATHWFAKIGVIGNGASLGEEADRMDKLWQAPTFLDLHAPLSWAAMSRMEAVAAWIVGLWVHLVVAALLAYLITYAASASTAVYCLLRHKVDATDLDDVYIEEAEEETPAAPAPEAPAPAPAPEPPPPDATGGQPAKPQ